MKKNIVISFILGVIINSAILLVLKGLLPKQISSLILYAVLATYWFMLLMFLYNTVRIIAIDYIKTINGVKDTLLPLNTDNLTRLRNILNQDKDFIKVCFKSVITVTVYSSTIGICLILINYQII